MWKILMLTMIFHSAVIHCLMISVFCELMIKLSLWFYHLSWHKYNLSVHVFFFFFFWTTTEAWKFLARDQNHALAATQATAVTSHNLLTAVPQENSNIIFLNSIVVKNTSHGVKLTWVWISSLPHASHVIWESYLIVSLNAPIVKWS